MELGKRGGERGSRLLFFAVPEEAGPFRKAWVRSGGHPWTRRTTAAGTPVWSSGNLQVVVTGMGPRNARRVAETLVGSVPADWVVTAGFAGGLDPRHGVGTVGYSADSAFPAQAIRAVPGVQAMTFLEVDRVAATAAAKRELRGKSGADAVEMESATIRALCRERGVPSATVRVISDAADECLPLDFGSLMTPDDRLDFVRLAWALMSSPGRIPDLIRFQQKVGRAAEALARALVEVART